MTIILRIIIFAVIINGMSQAFNTYAIVPDKYEDKSYSSEEVKKIAYKERAEGIRFIYQNSTYNAVVYTVLGILFGLEMCSRKTVVQQSPISTDTRT